MDRTSSRRVVITGRGVVSPLGIEASAMLEHLRAGKSGIGPFTQVPQGVLSVDHGAEATEFTGDISNYGPLEKPLQRTIRKGSKVMCREIEMGVAVAQLALHDSALSEDKRVSERVGVVYGSDYIMSLPEEFSAGILKCMDEEGEFDFDKWGGQGRPQVNPLWLLKYLPNMPASHIAIYNNLRGPNNSITVREASGGAALGEAVSTIERGHADALIVGA
ncbi:MAG: beta-ketoacyl synthase N-terminal-like domain-containing protein, partial [Novipirellula sp. JB048]